MERARGEQDTLCAIASPLSPYLGWLADSVCVCNGQQSSEIFCDKCTGYMMLHVSASDMNRHEGGSNVRSVACRLCVGVLISSR
jgi:hypothetical protein